MNRLPYWSNASSCGLRRPVAKTSSSVPSGLQRSTEPVSGTASVRPSIGRHVEAAVADAEIQPAVGPELEAVQVVAEKPDVNAVAVMQAACGDPPGRRRRCRGASRGQGMHVYQTSPFRASTPAPMPAAGSLNPSAKTVASSARPSPSRSTIRRTRSCSSIETRERLAQIFLVHGHAVGDGPAGQVVVEPVHVPAGVGHAGAMTERLGDVDDPLFIDAEGDRVGQERLGREQLDGQPRRHAE